MSFDVNKINIPVLNNVDKIHQTKNTEFEIKNININNIQRSDKNFYEIKDIDELAEDIKINSLYHNILVREIESSEETPKYELISGERRLSAYRKLAQDGHRLYNIIPCKVIKVNDEDAEIILNEANAQTRILSNKERVLQVQKLTTLYQAKKDRGEKIPGRIQKHIAETLGTSSSTIGKIQKIANNLSPELKEKFFKDELSLSNADTFASLNEEQQNIVNEILEERKLSKEEAIELKDKLVEISNNSIQENEENTSLENSSNSSLQSIKKEFSKSTKSNLNHVKELDLSDKIKKINNMITKLIKDLDRKEIHKFEEGINLLPTFEKNVQELLSLISEKHN